MIETITDWPVGVYADSEVKLPEFDQETRGEMVKMVELAGYVV